MLLGSAVLKKSINTFNRFALQVWNLLKEKKKETDLWVQNEVQLSRFLEVNFIYLWNVLTIFETRALHPLCLNRQRQLLFRIATTVLTIILLLLKETIRFRERDKKKFFFCQFLKQKKKIRGYFTLLFDCLVSLLQSLCPYSKGTVANSWHLFPLLISKSSNELSSIGAKTFVSMSFPEEWGDSAL